MTVVDQLTERVRALVARSRRPRVIVGIAGAPGAGKTTLAQSLVSSLGGFPEVAHVPMDGFHLADAELARLGRTDRKGAADTFDPDGYAALLRRIALGEVVWAPAFERRFEQPIAQSVPVLAETRVVISEGNYLLLPEPAWQQVRSHFDEVWFVRTDDGERERRLLARHVEFGKTPVAARRWIEHTDRPNADLVSASSDAADLVVDL